MYNIDEFRSAVFGKYFLESKLIAAGKEKFMVRRVQSRSSHATQHKRQVLKHNIWNIAVVWQQSQLNLNMLNQSCPSPCAKSREKTAPVLSTPFLWLVWVGGEMKILSHLFHNKIFENLL